MGKKRDKSGKLFPLYNCVEYKYLILGYFFYNQLEKWKKITHMATVKEWCCSAAVGTGKGLEVRGGRGS